MDALDYPGRFGPVRVGRRLRDEHESLSRRCAALQARVRRGEVQGVSSTFTELAGDLLAHMAFEEHDLFPLLAFEAVGGPRLVSRLHAEHAEIRKQLGELEAYALDRDRLDALVALLERHRAREDEHLYPWALAREAAVDLV